MTSRSCISLRRALLTEGELVEAACDERDEEARTSDGFVGDVSICWSCRLEVSLLMDPDGVEDDAAAESLAIVA